jgi:hypothetical protein
MNELDAATESFVVEVPEKRLHAEAYHAHVHPRLSHHVPDGVRFYTEAFGFSKTSEPIPGVVVLRAGTSEICLLEKKSSSVRAPGAQETQERAGEGRQRRREARAAL